MRIRFEWINEQCLGIMSKADLTRLILVLSSSAAHLFLELNFSNELNVISL